MIKVMKISGYIPGTDKFKNEQWTVDGLSYDRYKEYHGYPTKRVWIRRDVIAFTEADINKDLYVEYNDKGRIVKVEVK